MSAPELTKEDIARTRLLISSLQLCDDKTCLTCVKDGRELAKFSDCLLATLDAAWTKLDKNVCNSGHVTLPLTLWDCPECHNETRRERDEAVRNQYAVVWRIVEKLSLGAGGCPDNLILEEVERLRAQVQVLSFDDIQKTTQYVSLTTDALMLCDRISKLEAQVQTLEGERDALKLELERHSIVPALPPRTAICFAMQDSPERKEP